MKPKPLYPKVNSAPTSNCNPSNFFKPCNEFQQKHLDTFFSPSENLHGLPPFSLQSSMEEFPNNFWKDFQMNVKKYNNGNQVCNTFPLNNHFNTVKFKTNDSVINCNFFQNSTCENQDKANHSYISSSKVHKNENSSNLREEHFEFLQSEEKKSNHSKSHPEKEKESDCQNKEQFHVKIRDNKEKSCINISIDTCVKIDAKIERGEKSDELMEEYIPKKLRMARKAK